MDETTQKIRALAKMGYPRTEILQAIRLMGCASMSSETVEQGHSFASNIMKRHKEYGEESLRCRSLIASIRCLVEFSPGQKKILAIEKQIGNLMKKRPQYHTGRQFYFQQLRCLASSWARDGRHSMTTGVSKALMKNHGASWASMAPHHRRDFEAKAAAARLKTQGDIEEKKKQLEADLMLLSQRLSAEDEQRSGQPLRMSSARWGAAEIRQIQDLFDGSLFASQKVAELREKARRPIQPPKSNVQRGLMALGAPRPLPAQPRPPWLGLVCRQRQFFSDCIFRFQASLDEIVFARPTFIRQNPYIVGFVKLVPEDELMMRDWQQNEFRALRSQWNHVFGIDVESYCFSDQGGFDPEWSVSFLAGSVGRSSLYFVADSEWTDIDDIRSLLLDEKAELELADDDVAEEQPTEQEAPMWAKFPWLLEHDVLFSSASEGKGGDDDQADAAGPASDDEGPAQCLPSMSAEEIIETMYERRFHWAGRETEHEDFKVQLRGGRWTQQSTGMCYDSFRGFAMKGLAEQMCTRLRLGSTATFAIRAYAEEGAHRLASMWCHKMQYFMNWWQSTGFSPDPSCPDDVLAAYSEPAIEVELSGEHWVAFNRRLAGIRAMRPR